MKKGSFWVGLAVFGIMVVAGYFSANAYLKSKGTSLGEVISAIFAVTSNPRLSGEGWEVLNLSEGQKQQYADDKQNLNAIMQGFDFSDINSNENATNVIRGILGDNYTMYMYTFIEYDKLKYPVFERTILFINGSVHSNEEGKAGEPDMNIGLSHSIMPELMSGAGQESIMDWLSQGMIKVYPASQIMKFTTLLPQVIGILS